MRFISSMTGRSTLALIGLSACGGSDNAPVIPPPPAPVASVEVTPSTAQVVVGGTTQLTAIARDAAGVSLAGRTTTWSAADQSVATVSSAGVVTGVGAGEAGITATIEGKSAAARVTVGLANFQPGTNVSLSGSQRFKRVAIPAGVTITATGALTLSAEDSLIVRGTITGNCVPLTLIGASVLVEGDVRNLCAIDPDVDAPPALRIISGSTMELGAGVTESSGDIVVTNDTTLTDSDFPVAPRLASHAFMAPAIIRGNCRTSGRTWRFPQRQPGRSGQFGGDGRPGRTFRMDCAGDLILANGATIQAQHGGDGGTGTHTSVIAAVSSGGNGGVGGKVRLAATGSIIVAGIGNEIRTGNGGAGGSATATGGPDPGPDTAASATATGGKGAPPGLAEILAGGSITPAPGGGGLTIVAGRGGTGGEATANGQTGIDASARGRRAQHGGSATAVGGDGASTHDKRLVAFGSVLLNVGVAGGNAGPGGSATATSGKGGDGNEAFPPGADGGRMEGVGGFAGNADVRDAAGSLVGNGGAGGSGTLVNGLGGNGFSDCAPGNRRPGGPGGRGGSGFGQRGAAGTGKFNGASSVLRAINVGRGGNGGNGAGSGSGGRGGVDQLIRPAGDPGAVQVNGSFVPGNPGQDCPPIPIAGNYRVSGTLISITGPNCPAGFFPMTFDNPGPIAITQVGNQVRIQSDFLVSGPLAADGAYSGSGSGSFMINGMNVTALELVRGVWRETPDGGVTLEGELEYQMFQGGGCKAIYSVTYTRLE